MREGWSIYGKQWKKIAAHVGHGKDRSQCQHRWAVYLDPQLTLRKTGPWSDEEVRFFFFWLLDLTFMNIAADGIVEVACREASKR